MKILTFYSSFTIKTKCNIDFILQIMNVKESNSKNFAFGVERSHRYFTV